LDNLWKLNTPANFWQCSIEATEDQWQQAALLAAQNVGLANTATNIDSLLADTLGEGQFGSQHWKLSMPKRVYYSIRGFLPRRVRTSIRSLLNRNLAKSSTLGWPIEDRYARFQWETLRQMMLLTGQTSLRFKNFWPGQYEMALVLTHDIESPQGQSFVHAVADLEESLGFHSSFNYVARQFPGDRREVKSLAKRGFEIGMHGLQHDRGMFSSKAAFLKEIGELNPYFPDVGAVGFRAPFTHRQPEWMQALDMEYDLSFFDTDPFEPISGGTMSIWPFIIGKFVELPYTLVQDNTLVNVLGEQTPRIWLEKVDFLRCYRGMVLINSHPDYLQKPAVWEAYSAFLKTMKEMSNVWNPLPVEAARWWRQRMGADSSSGESPLAITYREARLQENHLVLV
jgi:peptidoglycan/xylan/chitin deacetylase (PgdA/CDA1 family)